MIFTRKNRIIENQRHRIEHLEALLGERDNRITSLEDFGKQVGLRVGMNPGTKNGDLFVRLDALQRNTVVLNIVKDIIGGVDWTNTTQEEIVTASMAALEVMK